MGETTNINWCGISFINSSTKKWWFPIGISFSRSLVSERTVSFREGSNIGLKHMSCESSEFIHKNTNPQLFNTGIKLHNTKTMDLNLNIKNHIDSIYVPCVIRYESTWHKKEPPAMMTSLQTLDPIPALLRHGANPINPAKQTILSYPNARNVWYVYLPIFGYIWLKAMVNVGRYSIHMGYVFSCLARLN